MPKAVHRSGCRDKYNWLQPLTRQSVMPSLNHCDLLGLTLGWECLYCSTVRAKVGSPYNNWWEQQVHVAHTVHNTAIS